LIDSWRGLALSPNVRSWAVRGIRARLRDNGLLLACAGLFAVFFVGMGLSIFLRQRGSAESKPVAQPLRETGA
jgi:hypothetical protein